MSQLVERFSQREYWEELISFYVGLKLRGFMRMANRSRMNREVHVRLCVQVRLVYSAGVSPARLKIRSPVAWMAGMRETDYLKPIDKAILERIQNELVSGTYRPMRNRIKAIPNDKDKVRVLEISAIRDRVVQGALKLILEPIFEADFQEGSYEYRPKRTAHAAVDRLAEAVVKNKTRVIDLDLKAHFDNVRHNILIKKVAERVDDDKVM